MDPLAERVATRFLADLHPPLGKPGGPCQVVERIEHNIRSPRLKNDLVQDVNHGADLSNSDASKVYPMLAEHGVGPIKQVHITSHGQYRMDLRGITVDDVRHAIGSFLQQMGEWKAKKNPAYERMNGALERSEKLEWVDPKTRLKVVLAPTGGGAVTLISTFWKGQPDPPPPQGACTILKRAWFSPTTAALAMDKLAHAVVARFRRVVALQTALGVVANSDSLPLPQEMASHPALTEEMTQLYPNPWGVGGWLGTIDGGSWIAFIGTDGESLLWTQREPSGGIIGLPFAIRRDDLAKAPTVTILNPALDPELFPDTGKVAAKYKKKIETEKGNTVYQYSARQVAQRNKRKAERIEALRKSIGDLRRRVKRDVKSADPEKSMTALVVALIDHTYERVGNEGSADDGHYGVTGWKKKHVTFGRGTATIRYTGKSGVKQEKKVTDAALKQALREAYEACDKDSACLFEGEWGSVTADKVNEYLEPFGITAKDIRGFHANREMQTRLKEIRQSGKELSKDKRAKEKQLKEEFLKALDATAEAVGHEASTLRSQYLVPGLEENYLKNGTVSEKMSALGIADDQSLEDRVTARFLRSLI